MIDNNGKMAFVTFKTDCQKEKQTNMVCLVVKMAALKIKKIWPRSECYINPFLFSSKYSSITHTGLL